MKIKRKKIFVLLSAVLICFLACFVYLSDYYHADSEAIAAFSCDEAVQCRPISERVLAFVPPEASVGLVFYPGGKVEYTAYEPLMRACAEKGIVCVIVEMPFNLAVLDINAAEGIKENFPEIKNWYLGGHSLGGSMAASYLADKPDEYSGLVLLASYSTADLSDSGLEVLSVYGSEDKVLNQEKYEQYKSNLPADFSEHLIDGGNHAGFGMYGEQEGDGEALISNKEQINLSAAYIAEFIK